jgi:hypothetical protein
MLDGSATTDPDGDQLTFTWFVYPEPGGFRGESPAIEAANRSQASLAVPKLDPAASLHIILAVTDGGNPPLTRYARVVLLEQD